jgi:hypothetical protein
MSPPSEVPPDWAQIREHTTATEPAPPQAPTFDRDRIPPFITLVGGAWGDLVAVLAVCTAAFMALATLGYDAASDTIPWALALGALWWAAAAAILLVIRQGTPGMLMAGMVFDEPIPRRRVGWVVLAALVLAGMLGLPALLGARLSPLRLAAGVHVVSAPDQQDPGEHV